ncbi:FecR family protein [Actomonas aquatica]|uniref:FecR domain-containing protein n=1 Tax=Actomonas aquatica TaxID=2866162 RepID=A0ABZ1CER3_9BACT|nr:FecR domain-containing protein [Opitutus sp. WL0086]WRQ88770.1 FecR domain-containing protein [Opitutus sp. WL0086]
MNPSPSRPESSLEETASLWAARLEGATLTADQRNELDSWLDADPSHREALSNFCQLSTDLERHLPQLLSSGSVTMPVASPAAATRPARHGLVWGWLTATAVAALALTTLWWQSRPAPASPTHFATAVAQSQSVILADGTHVDLNAGTRLVVEHTAKERRVRLAGGQAFFQVTKDPSRPFIVDTPAGSVRVTGTAFDVRTPSSGQIEVTVQEGSVQVRLGPESAPADVGPISLTAEDQLTSHGPAAPLVRRIGSDGVADALAWRDGMIVFDRTPMEEALARFAQFHGRGISAAPQVSATEVSGRYPLANLDFFLNSLESVFPVTVIHDQSGTIRVLPRA